MSKSIQNGLTRIGVFYDGNYYLHVSNYYNYVHPRRSRLSIEGLHHFIRHQVAMEQASDVRLCQIVDAHFFRGRLNAQEASQKGNQLYYDRVFDDILMSEGVVTHYLPLRNYSGYRQEKGIDVWLALETFELTQYKQFDVVVLITSDGDYVPLIRKLNTIGTRVMVLSWDFEYVNEDGTRSITRTSQDLLEHVTYPIAMHEIIENRLRKNDPVTNNLFVQPTLNRPYTPNSETNAQELVNFEEDGFESSEIHSLKAGYGFIKHPPNNLYFHSTSLFEIDFNQLQEGDFVDFILGTNEKGDLVAKKVRLSQDPMLQ